MTAPNAQKKLPDDLTALLRQLRMSGAASRPARSLFGLDRLLGAFGRARPATDPPPRQPVSADQIMAGLGRLAPQAASWAQTPIALEAELWDPSRYQSGHGALYWRGRPEMTPGPLAPLYLMHHSGFVRQAALEAMGPPDNAFVLAVMASRLNDWVPQVREAARVAMCRVLPLTPAPVIVEAGPYLAGRWRHWARWGPEEAALIDGLYERPDVVTAVSEALRTGRAGPRSALLRQVLRGNGYDHLLPMLAREAFDPAVRAVALKALLEGEASWPAGFKEEWVDKTYNLKRRVLQRGTRPLTVGADRAEMIGLGLADRSAAVRRVAADAATSHAAELADPAAIARRLLADASPSLRERGQWLARFAAGRAAG